jgi:exosortase A
MWSAVWVEIAMTDQRVKGRWSAAWIGLLLSLALWLYRDTAAAMVALWDSSETFAHGYVVPLISLWLIWRLRADIAAMTERFAPAPSALIAIGLAGAAWLVGEAANVNALRQFALVAMLVLIVPAVAGWALARALAFPLGFLFFAVPFGDFMLPWLMQWTADFTVMALRLTGVPVYHDGLQLIIPSGTWSVVEACSGVRYLIASVMVGAIFSYLHYRSARRRWLFMLVAVLVPIVANWLRAYGIVMLGHLSGNKLAVGVDHLIYGWVFFGVVIGLMFLIGMRWSEPEAEAAGNDSARTPVTSATEARARGGWWPALVAAATLGLLALPLVADRLADRAVELAAPRLPVPTSVAALPSADALLPKWTPAFVNPAASFNRRVLVAGQPVGLFVGYYRNQDNSHKLVSSSNALVRADDKQWLHTASGQRALSTPAGPINVRTALLRDRLSMSDSSGLTVWQFYWVDGAFDTSDARAKLRGAWQRLRGAGDDGAVVVLYTSAMPRTAAEAALEAFLSEHLGTLQGQLRATREGD